MSAMFPLPAAAAIPSGRTLNALLQYADVQEELGGGRVRLRLSPARLKQRAVKAALGADAARAADLAVVYDEHEAEVVEVTGAADAIEDYFAYDQPMMLWNSYAHAKKRRDPAARGMWR
jgi:hypothetical protein